MSPFHSSCYDVFVIVITVEIVGWTKHCGKETERCDSGAKPCQHCCKTRASNINTIPLEGIKQRQIVRGAVREKSAFNLLHGRFQHWVLCVLSLWEKKPQIVQTQELSNVWGVISWGYWKWAAIRQQTNGFTFYTDAQFYSLW